MLSCFHIYLSTTFFLILPSHICYIRPVNSIKWTEATRRAKIANKRLRYCKDLHLAQRPSIQFYVVSHHLSENLVSGYLRMVYSISDGRRLMRTDFGICGSGTDEKKAEPQSSDTN
jgi:hypothetical protein